MLEDLLSAAILVFNWQTLIAISLGTIVGLMIGAIPGLSATMGMALLSPFTFFVDPLVGIPFLIGLFKGGTFGGSVSAILIGTPGTAANAATLLDGYEMRKKGKAGDAILGALALIAIKFGPLEFFSLILFSLTMICYVSGPSLAKGVLAATMGLLFALIGTDPLGGTPRLTFGLLELQGGLNVIALVTGLFGITEVLVQIEKFGPIEKAKNFSKDVYLSSIKENISLVSKHLRTIIRSSMIGTFIGALPGIGSETSPWVAYGLAKRASKKPEDFGKGSLDGVLAPEAANNAVCGAAMIPMLVFGIPGDIVTAILMSALIAQGLQPGPFLIVEHREVIYGLFMSVLFATFALYIFGRLTLRWWMKILTIPPALLYSLIVAFCVVGTYSVKTSSFDLAVMFVFGVIGYIFRKLDIVLAPMLLAFVLAKILEESLRRGLVMVDGNLMAILQRPIAATILFLTLLVLITFAIIEFRKRKNSKT